MKYLLKILAMVTATTVAAGYLAIQPTAIDRDNATPKPATPVWQNERELIVLFEESDDRVAMSLLVRDASLNMSNGLTPQQRYDGLAVAGHTLYREGKHESAITCFEGIIALNYSNLATADAARMEGQSYSLLGEYQSAVDAYQLCDAVSRQIEADSGFNTLYRSNIMAYLHNAQMAGDAQLAYTIADDIIANYALYADYNPVYGPGQDIRVTAMKTAAMAAEVADDSNKRAQYISALLSQFPDFGTQFPYPRIKFKMDLLDAQGHSLSDRDPAAVDAAMAIVQDEAYYGSPIWAYYVYRSAEILEEVDAGADANKLRMWAVDRIAEKMGTLSSSDPNAAVYEFEMRKSQATLIYQTALKYQEFSKHDEAIELYNRLVGNYADVSPQYAAYASRRLSGLQTHP